MVKSDPCHALQELLSTMHRLRAPGGCSWDAEQTPESLVPYLLEESCEVIEAIESGNPAAIVDELGDLLLQIIFQAEIFAERGLFDFADIATAITCKLRRRHPHVFTETPQPGALTIEELDHQWDRIKQLERAARHDREAHPLGTLPGSLPALQRAQKLLSRARRKGLTVSLTATVPPPAPHCEKELGELLLALVAHAERVGIDAEGALRRTVQRALKEAGANDSAGTAAEGSI